MIEVNIENQIENVQLCCFPIISTLREATAHSHPQSECLDLLVFLRLDEYRPNQSISKTNSKQKAIELEL